MKNKIKVNRLRLVIVILLVILVIAGIVFLVKCLRKDNKQEITLDGTNNVIDEGKVISNSQDIEYDGNPYNVPQDYTQTTNEYINETGDIIDQSTLTNLKQDIENKFRSIPNEKLGINVDMSNISIIFNQVTTTIAGKNCLVFAVYEEKGNESNFISKFAMSIDMSVLYKFDSNTLIYNMIEM